MRRNWKKLIMIIALLHLNCMTFYKARTAEEIDNLNQPVVPLPENLITIPEFNGKDILPVFIYSKSGIGSKNAIYNNGLLKIKEQSGKDWSFIQIEIYEVRDLINKLNNSGFFNVTEQSIEEKKYVKIRSCCLFGIFLYPPTTWPSGSVISISIMLKGINYQIKYYDLENDIIKYSTLQDLKTLKAGFNLIDNFLSSKRLGILEK